MHWGIYLRGASRCYKEREVNGFCWLSYQVARPEVATPTKREEDVVKVVADRLSNRHAAQKLVKSTNFDLDCTQSSNYLFRIYEKLWNIQSS
jgi:hypothetical protein